MGVEIKLDCEQFGQEVGRQTVALIAADISREAKKLVRVKTRRLQNSIRIDAPNRDTRIVLSDTPYSAAQEYGRPDLPNYGFDPYMRPGAQKAAEPGNVKKRTAQAVNTARAKAKR